MDQSEVLKFEQQTRITKLSQAIRNGHKLIRESHTGFLACGAGCALGAAWVGSGKTENEYLCGRSDMLFKHLEKYCGVPLEVLNSVSRWHFWDRVPRLQIADKLEEMGY